MAVTINYQEKTTENTVRYYFFHDIIRKFIVCIYKILNFSKTYIIEIQIFIKKHYIKNAKFFKQNFMQKNIYYCKYKNERERERNIERTCMREKKK